MGLLGVFSQREFRVLRVPFFSVCVDSVGVDSKAPALSSTSNPDMRRPLRTGLAIALALVTSTTVALGQRGAPPPGQTPAPAVATGAISGVVVDSVSDRPLPGAVVTLSPFAGVAVNAGLAAPGQQMRQITDELGRFVFTGLPGKSSYTITSA